MVQKGYEAYEACLSAQGCGYAFLVGAAAKKWEVPAFEESGNVETVNVKGKPKMTDFRVTSAEFYGYMYTSVKTKTGYNSPEHPGNWESMGTAYETWVCNQALRPQARGHSSAAGRTETTILSSQAHRQGLR